MKTSSAFLISLFLFLSTLLNAQTIVEWTTNHGSFRVELRDDLVPNTANNFINLTNQKFYDGLIFHRIIDGFMIQDGCPLGDGTGGPGYEFDDEFHPDLKHDAAGILSMANSGPNTNGSQYFITLDETDWLDNVHSVFGKVTSGLDVVREIGHVQTNSNDRPLVDVVIDSIRIVPADRFITVLSPVSAIHEIRGLSTLIKWESKDISDVKIEYSFDVGETWHTVVEKVAANTNQYLWQIPDETTNQAKIRITDIRDDNNIALSETFIVIDNPLPIVKLILNDAGIVNDNNPENDLGLGKKVKFKVQIVNNTENSFDELSAKLYAEGNYFSILDSQVVFNNISPGATSISVDEFEIEIANFIVGDFELKFACDVLAEQNLRTVFSIPMLQIFNMEIDDDEMPESNGNDNDIIEYEETIQFRPLLNNKTSYTLNEVEAELKSQYWHIHIWNNIEGENDTIRSKNRYHVLENVWTAIPPTTNNVYPEADYIFDYWFDQTYSFSLNLIVEASVEINQNYNEEAVYSQLQWNIPIELNKTSPDAPVSIRQIKSEFIRVFPNPFHDEIICDWNDLKSDHQPEQILLFDGLGKEIMNVAHKNGNNRVMINTLNLNTGIYFIKIVMDQKIEVFQLIKTEK